MCANTEPELSDDDYGRLSLVGVINRLSRYDYRAGRHAGWREASAALMEIAAKHFALGQDREATLLRDAARTINQRILETIDTPLTTNEARDLDRLWVQIDARQHGVVPVDGHTG